MVAIVGWVLTSHSPTHGGRCRQPDVHVLSTDYHRGHKDLLNCHWGGDFLDECLTAVLGCLLRYPTPVRTPSRLWLIWPTGTINLVPAKLGSLKWSYPFLPGRGSHKHLEWAGPFYWIWSIRGVVAVPFVRIGGGWGELNGKKRPPDEANPARGQPPILVWPGLGQAKILHYSIIRAFNRG